jgi:hypothetical protein
MKKHLFHISVGFAAGVKFQEIVEMPEDSTEEEIEEEFKEWVWNHIDAWRTEV